MDITNLHKTEIKPTEALQKFKHVKVKIENLFLDANNPRFHKTGAHINKNDSTILKPEVQQDCRTKIADADISQLEESMLTMGYIHLNSILVRPAEGYKDQYIVLEGNRRTYTLQNIMRKIDIGDLEIGNAEGQVSADVFSTLHEIDVICYEGNSDNFTFALQGISHLIGTKGWPLYAQAKFLNRKMIEDNLLPSQAGKTFGYKPAESRKLIYAYYAFEQLLKDEDYKKYADTTKFSHFVECFSNKVLFDGKTSWLNWDESKKEFTNISNLKTFYKWVFEPLVDKNGKETDKVRLQMAIHVRKIPLFKDKSSIVSQFDNNEDHTGTSEYGIVDAVKEASLTTSGKSNKQLLINLQIATKYIGEITDSLKREQSDLLIEELDEIIASAKRIKNETIALKNNSN